MKPRAMLYRNAGFSGRTVYHVSREDWVRSGKAECGADIARPAFVAEVVEAPLPLDAQMPIGRRVCKRCSRRIGR